MPWVTRTTTDSNSAADINYVGNRIVDTGTLAQRPGTGLTQGELYYATDNGRTYQWTGAAWIEQMKDGGWQSASFTGGTAGYCGIWINGSPAGGVGNGTFATRWKRIGKLLTVSQKLTYGTTSVASLGAGYIEFGISDAITAVETDLGLSSYSEGRGIAHITCAGTLYTRIAVAYRNSARVGFFDMSHAEVTNVVPGTFANGDFIYAYYQVELL